MDIDCTLYTFIADAPHGVIQVARLTTRHVTDEYGHDLMIDFPERFIQDHPQCVELKSMAGVVFVDDRDIDDQSATARVIYE
jgi:hypothetical protein